MKERSDKHTSDIDYKSYVGPRANYDITGANQFSLLVKWGLREHHTLLDYGCGSLRAGKLFIPYLLSDKYYGFEPNIWLVDEGLENETGFEVLDIKRPVLTKDLEELLLLKDLLPLSKQIDYILIHSIFSHAPIKLINEILQNINRVSGEKTQIFLTFISGENDYNGEEWKYPGGVRYTKNTMIKIFTNHKFKYQFLKWKHPGNQQWVRLCKKVS